jgi:hypothetical protein
LGLLIVGFINRYSDNAIGKFYIKYSDPIEHFIVFAVFMLLPALYYLIFRSN